ncbi:MAG TPA: EAL domain-containing protein, partial [Nitrospiria bacterium]|nr:EAL domain-containing protein [Nitrospiria bacterium]
GLIWARGDSVWIADVANETNFSRAPYTEKAGLHSAIGFPILLGGQTSGVMIFFSQETRRSNEGLLSLFSGIGNQIGQFIERKNAERGLKSSEERYRGLADNAIVGIYQSNLKGDILYVNIATLKMFGFESTEEMATEGALARYKDPNERERLIKMLKQKGKVSNFEIEMLTKGGEAKNILISGTLDGEIISGMSIDITDRKQAEEQIRHLAYYDLLTDLPNRLMFYDSVDRAITAARKELRLFALLIIDLDHFKDINDTLGHHQGDSILASIADRLKNIFTDTGTVSRLGGDDFTVILPGADVETVSLFVDKITKSLDEPFLIGDIPLNTTACIGVSFFPGHGEDTHTLLRRADIALHEARKQGINWAIYSPEYDKCSSGHLALIGALRHAIDSNQMFLLYQPKIDLKTNKTIDAEALVRWQHPTRGVIPPDQFIFLAEHSGLIKQLTLWVLSEALRQSRGWQEAGRDLSVAVNLSVRSLQAPMFLEQITGLLSTWGVPPIRLRLEITESVIMSDPELAMEIITQLTLMGVRFSIDDFGTGYSSLKYLQRLSVDEIKIDKSFIINMLTDEDSLKIVRSTIELAHSLGLKVVAEGVESKEILNELTSLGCDAAQGYFISRPISHEDLIVWLKRQGPGK